MKEFLVGLPITLIGLLLIFVPTIIFGEIFLNILAIILLIVALVMFSWMIGSEILDKQFKKEKDMNILEAFKKIEQGEKVRPVE
ncbi:hypothetical protein [Peptacetobacter sp. AB800]|uniref:hypothetical protein n=1 Tax=Peptacetobacter sp. AB800 TaxID=3388428 RepID=UPI0039FDC825